MEIRIPRNQIMANRSDASRKYCLECDSLFEPTSLQKDPHATHYSLFLPAREEEFDNWLDRVRNRDEAVWGFIMDEDGVTSHPYCPPEFTLTVE